MEVVDKHMHTEQRNRVIGMAGKMFAERGIRAVRMDDVAAALGMSKRTLYEMFADKEELLLEGLKLNEERKREFVAQVVATAGNVLEMVLRIYQHGMNQIKNVHPSLYQDFNKYSKVADFLKQQKEQSAENTKNFYQVGIQQGLFLADINFEIFQFLMDLSMGGFLNDRVLMEKWTLPEVLDTVVRVNMRGICTEKGMRMLDEFFEREIK